MMAIIPPAVLPRVGSLLRLLGSDQDHEALGAVRALRRTLSGVGLDLHDLASAIEHPAAAVERPEPAPQARRGWKARPGDIELDFMQRREVVEALRRGLAGGRMTEWERSFAGSLIEQLQSGRGRLTEKQKETLGRLLRKLGEDRAWA